MGNNPVIDGILSLEGGYVNNPADRGGATNWGITEATARAWGYTGDMRDLTRVEAYEILETNYWKKPGYDRIAHLSLSLAFELCDAGVNTGPAHPSRWLQRWLNAFNQNERIYPDLNVDGVIGNNTLQALQRFFDLRGKEGERILVTALNCSQGQYYLEITESRKLNETFVYGWLRERVIIK